MNLQQARFHVWQRQAKEGGSTCSAEEVTGLPMEELLM